MPSSVKYICVNLFCPPLRSEFLEPYVQIFIDT